MYRTEITRHGNAPLALLSLLVLVAFFSCGRNEKEFVKKIPALEIGSPAPHFILQDTERDSYKLTDYIGEGKMVVLEWFNPDCPFTRKHHETHKTMSDLYEEFHDKGVVFLAINSSGSGLQGYGMDRNRRAKEDFSIPYPILLDLTGGVGRLYHAKTTPHIFVINRDGTLTYRGAIDDDPSPDSVGDLNYVRVALEQAMAGTTISVKKTKPYGCGVKYRRI